MTLNRPEHADFYLLSALLQDYDNVIDDAETLAKKDARWRQIASESVDVDSLMYVAFQRAIRSLGITTAGEVQERQEEVGRLTAVYSEGLVIGAALVKRRERRADQVSGFVPPSWSARRAPDQSG